jgi:hypothetical protein
MRCGKCDGEQVLPVNCSSLTELFIIDVWTYTLYVRMREQKRFEFDDSYVLCCCFGRSLMTASNGMEIVAVSRTIGLALLRAR